MLGLCAFSVAKLDVGPGASSHCVLGGVFRDKDLRGSEQMHATEQSRKPPGLGGEGLLGEVQESRLHRELEGVMARDQGGAGTKEQGPRRAEAKP